MKFALILFVLLAKNASAAPAEITLVVSDRDGERISGAQGIFQPWADGETITSAKTDKLGKAIQPIALPDGKPVGFEVTVSHEGYFPETVSAVATPGAKLTTEVKLMQRFVTKLRLLEADGSPAAHRRASFDYWDTIFTDGNGEFTFAHSRIKKPLKIRFRSENFLIGEKDAGTTTEIHPSGIPTLASPFDFHSPGTTYPRAEDPIAKLRGKLQTADGQPARGWLVAERVSKGPGMTAFSGGRIRLGDMEYNFYYQSLQAVADDGSFDFNPTFEDLFLVSPEGLPFRYPLNPAAWPDDSGVKETTLTVPKIETVKVKLRLGSAEGKPAAGYRVLPSLGRNFDRWTLLPTRRDIRYREQYANEPSAPGLLDSITAPATSNGDGEIELPVHPWRYNRRMALHPPDESPLPDGSWTWPSETLKDGDVIFYKPYKNAKDPSSKAKNFRDITITSFKDSSGKRINPERLRWSLSINEQWSAAGRGGFVPSGGGNSQRLTVGSGEGQLTFTYRNPRGFMDTRIIAFSPANPLPEKLALKLERVVDPIPSLSGIVLSPEGKPVPDIRLHLTDENTSDANKKYLQIFATTNRSGEFQFPKAPGECGATVAAIREEKIFSIDDSIELPEITPNNRKIEIRMKPTASLELRIKDAKALPEQLFLYPAEKKVGSHNHHYIHQTSADRSIYFSPFIAPGDYKIGSYATGLNQVEYATIKLRAGQEEKLVITIPEPVNSPDTPASVPVIITVTRNGKPVPGVIVKTMVEQADPNIQFGSHVVDFTGDITDESGKAHFEARPGVETIYAAVDHDLKFATKRFEAVDGESNLTLELGELADDDQKRASKMFRLPAP